MNRLKVLPLVVAIAMLPAVAMAAQDQAQVERAQVEQARADWMSVAKLDVHKQLRPAMAEQWFILEHALTQKPAAQEQAVAQWRQHMALWGHQIPTLGEQMQELRQMLQGAVAAGWMSRAGAETKWEQVGLAVSRQTLQYTQLPALHLILPSQDLPTQYLSVPDAQDSAQADTGSYPTTSYAAEPHGQPALQPSHADQADQQSEHLREARAHLFPHPALVPRPTLPPPFCLNQPGGC